MARTALHMGIKELAEAAEVSTNTTVRFERGEELKPRIMVDIRSVLENAGAVFIDSHYTDNGGPGVRLSTS